MVKEISPMRRFSKIVIQIPAVILIPHYTGTTVITAICKLSSRRIMAVGSEAVLDFWLKELEMRQWFVKDASVDEAISKRFSDVYSQAVNKELLGWRDSAKGSLAEVIVLDQFPRNMFRYGRCLDIF